MVTSLAYEAFENRENTNHVLLILSPQHIKNVY